MALFNLGSEKPVNMNIENADLDTRGDCFSVFVIRVGNFTARSGLIRDHQLAMPGLFNVMK